MRKILSKLTILFSLFILVFGFPFKNSSALSIIEYPNKNQPKNMESKLKIYPGYGNLPLYFISNKGQVHKDALFYAKTPKYTLQLTKQGLVFDSLKKNKREPVEKQKNPGHSASKNLSQQPEFKRCVSRLDFIDSKKNPLVIPIGMSDHRVHYFKGNDKSEWRTNLKTSRAVLYKNIYDKINLKPEKNSTKKQTIFILIP